MVSSFTTNKGLEKPANGDYVDFWNVPVNGDMDVIDQAFGGVTNLNATSGSVVLTDTQYRSLIISISGAIAAPVTYTIPSGVGGQWIVRNTTTDSSGGPHAVTIVSGGGGTSVVLDRNVNINVFSDGTNIRSTTTPVPGSDTQVVFNSSGAFGASANLTWNGTTFTASNVSTGNVTASGTLGVTGVATFSNTLSATAVSDSIGNVRVLPINTQTVSYALVASDSGKIVSSNGAGVTVPASVFSAGQTITIFNNSTGNMTVTQGSGVTMYSAGTTNTGNRTLDPRSLVTVVCLDPTTFVIAGAGLN